MAFDPTQPFGTSLGDGKTHGFRVQHGKMFNHNDDEVDSDGRVVRQARVVKAKQPATTDAQLQVQEQQDA